MTIQGKSVLVIGGGGFIGSHLVEKLLLEDVKEVIVYDNFIRGKAESLKEALKDPRCQIYDIGGDIMQTDILNSAMKGRTHVFHLAALWLLQCVDFPRSAFKTNIEGTFNVLEACVNNGIERLIYSSSASVYGDAVTEPMEESHPFNNTNFYGATKIAGEAMMTAFCHRYKLNAVGMRYMNVYGARQDYKGAYVAVIMKILDAIWEGKEPVLYGDGSQSYDFVYVEDCANANVCAAKANTTANFYNVGTGVKTSLKQLAETILKLTNSNLKIKYHDAGPTFVKNRVGGTKKASEEIGYNYSINLEEGLKRTIAWYESIRGKKQ